jgi:hypothetical protein
MANVNPPQAVPQLGPQPNFALLTQAIHQAGTELGNFANLPLFAQGNAFMQQTQQQAVQQQQFQQDVRQFQQDMRQFQQQTQGQFQQSQQDMQQLQQDMRQFQQSQQQTQQQSDRFERLMQAMLHQMNQNFVNTGTDIQTLRNDIIIAHQAT